MNTDYDYIRQLVELMALHDLSRVELHEADTHIVLRRGQPVIAAPMVAAAPPAAAPAPPSAAPPAAAPAAAAAPPPAADASETFIKSPMVGTFYAAADPESPPFVSIGAQIGPQTVVCIVEAMKVFNEIKAECSGRITRVLAKNGQAVEYDQPLFAVSAN